MENIQTKQNVFLSDSVYSNINAEVENYEKSLFSIIKTHLSPDKEISVSLKTKVHNYLVINSSNLPEAYAELCRKIINFVAKKEQVFEYGHLQEAGEQHIPIISSYSELNEQESGITKNLSDSDIDSRFSLSESGSPLSSSRTTSPLNIDTMWDEDFVKIVEANKKHRAKDFTLVDFGENQEKTLIYDTLSGWYTFITPTLPIKNLVISGGGAKGIYLGGVVKALQEEGTLKNIDYIAGTSIGSITAAFLAAGMTSEEISQITNLEQYIDNSGIGLPIYKLINDRSKECIINNLNRLLGTASITDISDDSIASYLSTRGIKNETLVKDVIALVKQLNSQTCTITFNHLKILHQLCPEVFKELIVTATCCELKEPIPFYFDADHTPDLPISAGCRASAALPPALSPVTINKQFLTKGYKTYCDTLKPESEFLTFIDGGWLNNIPVASMEAKQDVALMKGVQGQNLYTLALVFDRETTKEEPQSRLLEVNKEVGNADLIDKLLSASGLAKTVAGISTEESFTDSLKRGKQEIQEKYTQRCIPIRTEVGTTEFSKAHKQAAKYQQEGYQQAMSYLEAHRGERVYHRAKDKEQLFALASDDQERQQLEDAVNRL